MTPEQSLWFRVITQSIRDAVYTGTYAARIADRELADHWLRHDEVDFRRVCVYAGVDPDMLRYRYVNGLIDTGALTYDSAS
jgi:hypothetical protein